MHSLSKALSYRDGTLFSRFRLCWCAAETLCVDGRDFDHDLGLLTVGGPDSSAVYLCYEWEPCRIDGLLGTDLNDGDMLLAISTRLQRSVKHRFCGAGASRD